MSAPAFPAHLLRPGSPTAPSFTVSEVPHQAKLDQNESPFDAPEAFKDRILEDLREMAWNRYPQPRQYQAIKAAFAESLGLPPERVVITAGCDQAIWLTFQAAGGPGRRARIFEPTYPMIPAYGRMTQTELDRVVLGPDFRLTENLLGDAVDLLVLVSPNNPTGDGPDRQLVLEALQRDCLVFLDEAYADFAGTSRIDLVEQHPNLFVGRSLSKALLAGVRLGYGVGHPELIQVMERLLFAPYHLSNLQLATARRFGLIRDSLNTAVDQVIQERERLTREMRSLGLTVWPSRGNFLLFQVENAKATYQHLLDQGVRIRDVSGMPGMGDHLRVSVGSHSDNDLFLEVLSQFATRWRPEM